MKQISSPAKLFRLAVLISGRGSNMAALIDATQSGKMSCCKRGARVCCRAHAKQRTETGFTAAVECPSQCSIGVASLRLGASLVAASQWLEAEPASFTAVSSAETIHSRSNSYLAFLYQLPPPFPVR